MVIPYGVHADKDDSLTFKKAINDLIQRELGVTKQKRKAFKDIPRK